jgi:hypothetical protein
MGKKMIQQVWTHFFEVWKIRCDKQHELDQSRVSKQHTHNAHARTRAIFAALDQLPAETRASSHFEKELNTQLDQSTRNIEVWLAHAEPLVQQGLSEAAQTVAMGHLDIREYFLPLDFTLDPD